MTASELVKRKYPGNNEDVPTFVPKSTTANPDNRPYFFQLSNKIEGFNAAIDYDLPKLLRGRLKERLRKAQKLHLRIMYTHSNPVERFRKLLPSNASSLSDQTLYNQAELDNMKNELTTQLQDLQSKGQLISNLRKQNFQYYNAAECDPNETDNEQMLERKLILDHRHDRILCSDDTLNNNNLSDFNKMVRELLEERKTNPNLHLIYADFSYCSFELRDMLKLPIGKNTLKQSRSSAFTEIPTSSNNNDVINILLLGETGVGKSTFINAFVNYLKFETIKQAQSNKPVVLIPVSFLITTGDNFQEHTVKFSDGDSSNNEDFDHPGQSVTQRCKSYVFSLDHNTGKKLRIIDTPGFGDTRGLDQDDRNMQHIIEYINNLTHVNAVCFLLKPNASRLNIFFRTCITQLLDLLSPAVRENIIFCFTNARSTFYTPGDTAPLLKSMLKSITTCDIPFKKENTFCFDNESFRYLVALQDGIRFNDEEKEEYEKSWSISVKESNRLIDYIRKNHNICRMQDNRQSVGHAQQKIIQMIRPILEAMRNTIRNRILSEKDSSNKSIKLCPQAVNRRIALCSSCKRDPFLLANFWILPDDPHELQDKCRACSCAVSRHIPVDYILSYDIVKHSSTHPQNGIADMLDRLSMASVEFAYFLIHVARSTKGDPFLSGLMRMIEEEKQICKEQQSNQHNLQLVEELEKLTRKYEGQMKNIVLNHKDKDLQVIYKWIKSVCEYPVIGEQLAAAASAE